MPFIGHWSPPPHCAAIDFISDLHLSADTPATFAALSRYLSHTSADAVLVLGDLFEVWVGDDARHDTFEQGCVDLFQQASTRMALGFMPGNRDFLVGDDMRRDCGMPALHDPTVVEAFGQRALLTHGDALCVADTDYQRFRQLVRSEAWQHDFLAEPLAQRRAHARTLREQSEARKRMGGDPSLWADVDANAAQTWLQAANATVLVHGHTHRPQSQAFATNAVRHVLTDWDLDHAPHRAEVLRWSATGFARLPLDAASR